MTTNAVIYRRVSSDEQAEKGFGLKGQLQVCTRLAEQAGYNVVGEFADRGKSGYQLEDRPALDKMFVRLGKGDVQTVIIWNMERFGRRTGIWSSITDRLEDLDVTLHLDVGGKDFATRQFLGAATTVMSKELREKLDRGKLNSVKAGSIQTGARPAMGYNKVTNKDKKHFLVVDPETAPTVLRIFNEYADGKSMAQIALGLNRDRVTTNLQRLGQPSSGKWHQVSIGKLIKNPVYIGQFTYRKTRRTSKTTSVLRPESEWLTIPVPVLIGQDVWDRCQYRLQANTTKGSKPKAEYLLRGYVSCGCGRLARIRKWRNTPGHYYLCSDQYNPNGNHCGIPIFNGERLEDEVIRWVLDVLLDRKALDEYIQQQGQASQAMTGQARKRLVKVEADLSKTETKLGRLVDLYTDEALDRATYDKKREKLDGRRLGLQEEQRQLQAQLVPVDLDLDTERRQWEAFLHRAHLFMDDLQEFMIGLAIDEDICFEQDETGWIDMRPFYRKAFSEEFLSQLRKHVRAVLDFLEVSMTLGNEQDDGMRPVVLTSARLGIETTLRIKGGR